MNSNQKKLILLLLFLICLQTVSYAAIIPLGNTVLWWIIDAAVLSAIVWQKSLYFNNDEYFLTLPIFMLLGWNIFSIVRGGFVAENYWEWKQLLRTGFILLLPLSIYVSTNRIVLQTIYNQYVKYMVPLFFIFTLLLHTGAFGRYLMPLSFLLLLLPVLPKKWKIFLIFFAIVGLTSSLAVRSNVIKFAIPLLLGLVYYLRPIVGERMLKLARNILMILPVLFFILAITGRFNIFKISDYVKGEYYVTNQAEGKQEDLTADTRTPLYIEVISSAVYNNYVWWGRTPARGNDSKLFGKIIESQTNTGKFERPSNEVSVLNVFTWTGLIGVLLYFWVFIKATYLALYKSRSWFVKIAGVYLAFRWCYAWVEDFSSFNYSYVFLWLFIGFCYSASFRDMTDAEFKYWACGIFDIKYRKATLVKKRVIKIFP